MEVVGLVARFQSTLKEAHVQVVKMDFRYSKGILDYDVWYSRNRDFILTKYIYYKQVFSDKSQR